MATAFARDTWPKINCKQSMPSWTTNYRVWRDTTRNSANSALGSMIVMNVIGEGTGWNDEFYSKVAAILSSCEEVFSADVPAAVQALSAEIASSDSDREEVLRMSDAETVQWLLSAESGRPGEAFRKFLHRHGHRGVREAEGYDRLDAANVVQTNECAKFFGSPSCQKSLPLGILRS